MRRNDVAIAAELQAFVKDGLMRGASRAEIERVLGEAGWPAEQVGASSIPLSGAFQRPAHRRL